MEITSANQETLKLLNVLHKSEIKDELEKFKMKLKYNEMTETSEETITSLAVDETAFDS